MNLQPLEVDFLIAWAKEERAPNPYILPAHQLQATHGVKGVTLIRLIKAWARSWGRKDKDIFDLPHASSLSWPWANREQLFEKLANISLPFAHHSPA